MGIFDFLKNLFHKAEPQTPPGMTPTVVAAPSEPELRVPDESHP
jgi:hypothetical protein